MWKRIGAAVLFIAAWGYMMSQNPELKRNLISMDEYQELFNEAAVSPKLPGTFGEYQVMVEFTTQGDDTVSKIIQFYKHPQMVRFGSFNGQPWKVTRVPPGTEQGSVSDALDLLESITSE